jgi:RNA polymerase sigma factor FliA
MDSKDGTSSRASEATVALTEEQQRWVEHAVPRVGAIARALAPRIAHASLDELTSAGYEGLVEAAQRYDPGTGVPFTAFAYRRVKGAMIDHARRNAPALRRRSRALALLQASEALLEQAERKMATGPAADPRSLRERVAAAADLVAQQTTAVLLSRAAPADPDSLAEPTDVEAGLLSAELREQLVQLVRSCSADERALIEALYFEGRTMVDYARSIGKSVSTISRHHARVIDRLGRSLRARLSDPAAT